MSSPQAKLLADISVMLWERCRALGYSTKVTCSYRSLSRYVRAKNAFTIRLSDHTHNDDRLFDYQILVGPNDDPKIKMQEAIDLLAQIHGTAAAA